MVLEGPEIVKFSPADSRQYGVQGSEIRSWHWPSLVQTDETLPLESPIRELCISPDGLTLATLGVGDPPGTGAAFVTIYDLSTGTKSYRFNSKGELGSGGRISISADSRKLILGFMQNTRIIDLRTLEDTLNFNELGRGAAALSPDGKWLLTNGGLIDRLIHVRRAADGELVTQLQGHSLGVRNVKFSPDGKLVASASSDQTIRLWDTKTWSPVKVLSGHSCTVRNLVFSQEGALSPSSLDARVGFTCVGKRAQRPGVSTCARVRSARNDSTSRYPIGTEFFRPPLIPDLPNGALDR